MLFIVIVVCLFGWSFVCLFVCLFKFGCESLFVCLFVCLFVVLIRSGSIIVPPEESHKEHL